MTYILIGISIIGAFFTIRFYLLTKNLKQLKEELEEIKQNPEDNRILHFSVPQKQTENLMASMNEYILESRKRRIFYQNREKKLRAQIENISHDLRTPLTSIIGYLDLIEKEQLSEENRESLEVVIRKAHTLQNLIGNFYDLSRLEMDDYHLSPEIVDLGRFMQETMLQFYTEFEQRGLEVECRGTGNRDMIILADTGALSRIFHNMNQNALRYALSYYTVSLESQGDTLRMSFENDCTNLKEEDLVHIFERFYVKEKSRTNESTGLGLTINKLLTEAMGGNVTARLQGNKLGIVYEFPRFDSQTGSLQN